MQTVINLQNSNQPKNIKPQLIEKTTIWISFDIPFVERDSNIKNR